MWSCCGEGPSVGLCSCVDKSHTIKAVKRRHTEEPVERVQMGFRIGLTERGEGDPDFEKFSNEKISNMKFVRFGEGDINIFVPHNEKTNFAKKSIKGEQLCKHGTKKLASHLKFTLVCDLRQVVGQPERELSPRRTAGILYRWLTWVRMKNVVSLYQAVYRWCSQSEAREVELE